MSVVLSILSYAYFSLLLIVIWGIILLRRRKHRNDLTISVIIPCWNEEENLPGLFKALQNLDYPRENYEVILVNDCSTDNTGSILKAECELIANWQYLEIKEKPENLKGKKFALTKAIELSSKEIILVTDADCQPKPNWLTSMAGCFNKDTGVVLGHSPIIELKDNLKYKFFAFENLVAASFMAAGTPFRYPASSCARNLAYRKKVFKDIDGYNSSKGVPSGDDIFLTQDVTKKTNWKFGYNIDEESYVPTIPVDFGKKYFKQQMRRNGKIPYWLPLFKALGLVIISYHLLLLIMLITNTEEAVYSLMVKLILEFIGFSLIAVKLKKHYLIRLYPFFYLVYLGYISFFSIIGSLRSKFAINNYAK